MLGMMQSNKTLVLVALVMIILVCIYGTNVLFNSMSSPFDMVGNMGSSVSGGFSLCG